MQLPDNLVLAFDLGTGGLKAVLFGPDGRRFAKHFETIETYYPRPAFHEQKPEDWWRAVKSSIHAIFDNNPELDQGSVSSISISGHSLGAVPLDEEGNLLTSRTPIWSDGRAESQAAEFFKKFDETAWYELTGNGFPTPLYPLFKTMWYKQNAPEVFYAAKTIIGTKDYINFLLTGSIATDHSYASGSGFYDLRRATYSNQILNAAELDIGLFPKIALSTDVIGTVTEAAAKETGLVPGTPVYAGGVDNSCMALGARTFTSGDLFLSMGSSSWLSVSTPEPLIDARLRPYTFTHVVPGQFVSATSTFSSGTTIDWVREILLADVDGRALDHETIERIALDAPPGANGLLLVPTLGGGTVIEGGSAIRGAFVGLGLEHKQSDISRAVFEGVAYALRNAFEVLQRLTETTGTITAVGGGTKSQVMREALSDIISLEIHRVAIEQDAAALGAAATAFVGGGVWENFDPINEIQSIAERQTPNLTKKKLYENGFNAFRLALEQQRSLTNHLDAYRNQ